MRLHILQEEKRKVVTDCQEACPNLKHCLYIIYIYVEICVEIFFYDVDVICFYYKEHNGVLTESYFMFPNVIHCNYRHITLTNENIAIKEKQLLKNKQHHF